MSEPGMNHLEWILLAEKTETFLAADRHGIFRDLAPEIERRIYEADPYKELRGKKEGNGMTIEVRSGKPIEQATLAKIKDIFGESDCPNESMHSSIPEFTSYDGKGHIQLAVGNEYTEHIEIR